MSNSSSPRSTTHSQDSYWFSNTNQHISPSPDSFSGADEPHHPYSPHQHHHNHFAPDQLHDSYPTPINVIGNIHSGMMPSSGGEDPAAQRSIEDVTQLFRACIVDDANARQQATYRLIQFLEECPLSQLQNYAPLLSRFTYACPYADISRRLDRFINDYDERGRGRDFHDYDYDDEEDDDDSTDNDFTTNPSDLDSSDQTKAKTLRSVIQKPIAPSTFITHPRSLTTRNEIAQRFLQQRFLDYGIVHHLPWILSAHPTFCKQYFDTFNFIMKENGPLPLHLRNYIAMIASARHNCDYLFNHEQEEFLYNGGPHQWLEGIEFAPKKIGQLMQFNALLAHQPWLLTSEHIKLLLQGEDAWTLAELVHAIIIMSTYHSLSGIIHGCGITFEHDGSTQNTSGDMERRYTESNPQQSEHMESSKEEYRELLQNEEDLSLLERLKRLKDEDERRYQMSQKERSKLFEKAEDVGSNLGQEHQYAEETPVSKLRGAFKLEYTDFNVRSRDYSAFVLHEYNWKEHAYMLMNRFVSGSGEQLEKEFNCIYHLTYKRVGRNGSHTQAPQPTEEDPHQQESSNTVDTSKFRQAIWFYSLRLFGVMNDDYNYQLVNTLLSRSCKSFIKIVCCYPEKITRAFFANMDQGLGVSLSDSEKIHICVLAVAARKQAELLYASRIINDYLTKK